jgi:hypothetical protein
MVDPWSTTQIQQRGGLLHPSGNGPIPHPIDGGGSIYTLDGAPTHVPPLFSLSHSYNGFCGVAIVYLRCFNNSSLVVAIICFLVFQLLHHNVTVFSF